MAIATFNGQRLAGRGAGVAVVHGVPDQGLATCINGMPTAPELVALPRQPAG